METSGTISLVNGVLRYESPIYNWQLKLEDVKVIGEATTDHGPYLDDYWFCFATGMGGWMEASFYAAGRDVFLRSLQESLDDKLERELTFSTDFASRVLWPAELAGCPMFTYEPNWPKGSMARAVVKVLGGPFSNTQRFSAEVEAYLKRGEVR